MDQFEPDHIQRWEGERKVWMCIVNWALSQIPVRCTPMSKNSKNFVYLTYLTGGTVSCNRSCLSLFLQ